jgi:hypothetical protein
MLAMAVWTSSSSGWLRMALVLCFTLAVVCSAPC